MTSSELGDTVSFGRFLRRSLIAHAVILGLVVIQGLVFPDRTARQIPLLKVDLVALPDLTKQEMIQIRKRAEPEAAKPAPVATKDRVASALARMRALRAASEEDKPTEQTDPAQAKPLKIKGNILTDGQSLSEDARETGVASYLDVIKDRIEANFAIPIWLKRLDPKARVHLQIAAGGQVISLRFIEPSGNSEYDKIVRQTIQSSSPFPPPDAGIADQIADQGIVIDFPLR